MKNLLYLSVSCLLMFASCSKDDEAAPGGNSESAQLTFEVAAVNDLEAGGVTRAPLYSQEAVQNVTDVKVYAFKNNGTDYVYQATYNLPNWTAGTTFQRYEVPSGSNVPIGDYKFLAVGRDANDAYTLPALTIGTSKFQDMVATVSASGNETEIFSGYTPVILTGPGSRVSILMVRAVAGVLGYFKVPTTINGTTVRYLRLSVSNSNQMVNLTTGVGINTTPAAFNIINMDLSGQAVSGNYYAGNDLSGQGVVKVPNSQLSGSFYTPVNGISMTLGLYDTGGNALKTWQVVSLGLPVFDILANHFYTLGLKAAAGSTTGDPANPADDDAPIDLMTDQTISITISPNWTLIHNLGLQDFSPI